MDEIAPCHFQCVRVSCEQYIVGFCFVCLGCYNNKNARKWMAHKQEKFISQSLKAESLRSGASMVGFW